LFGWCSLAIDSHRLLACTCKPAIRFCPLGKALGSRLI
jgi:hypothetical protein